MDTVQHEILRREVIRFRPGRLPENRYSVVPVVQHVHHDPPIFPVPVADRGDEVLAAREHGHVGNLVVRVEPPLVVELRAVAPDFVDRVRPREKPLGLESGEILEAVSLGGWQRREGECGSLNQALPNHGMMRKVVVQLAHL